MNIGVNYFKLGLFVLLGLFLLIIALIALGAGRFTQEKVFMETYFNESVQGLSSGSLVHYRGFPIGKVERISFVTQEYQIPPDSNLYDKYLKYVMVVLSVEKNQFTNYDREMLEKMFKTGIKEGARIRLTQNPLTGVSYLDIDFLDPKVYQPITPQWQPKYIYMPSAPSLMSTFTQTAEEAFKQISQIDIARLTKNADEMLVAVRDAFENADTETVSEQVKKLLSEMRETNSQFKNLLASQDPNMLATLPETVDRFDQTLREIQIFLKTKSGDVAQIISNIKQISSNLNQLSVELKQQPSRLLYSSPPPESEVLK